LSRLLVQTHPPSERARIEQVREEPDGVSQVDEPIVESPFGDVVPSAEAEGKVGQRAGLERCHDLVLKLILLIERELYLFTAALLESCDDISERLVLLGIGPLLPPHHEVGGLGAERCHDERGKDKGEHP
jgi:hypothetical protein